MISISSVSYLLGNKYIIPCLVEKKMTGEEFWFFSGSGFTLCLDSKADNNVEKKSIKDVSFEKSNY